MEREIHCAIETEIHCAMKGEIYSAMEREIHSSMEREIHCALQWRNMSDLTAAAEVECARSAIILTNTVYP